MSVSSRKPKVKRNPDPNSWRKKLDDEGVSNLEQFRNAKQEAAASQRKAGSTNPLDELIKNARAIYKKPEEDETWIKFKTANFSAAKEVEAATREVMSSIEIPSVAELGDTIFRGMEMDGADGRKTIALVLAAIVQQVWERFRDVRNRHFANAELTERQTLWVLGTALQTIGEYFRTGDPNPTTKGKVNTQLLELIRMLRQHEAAQAFVQGAQGGNQLRGN